MSAFRHLHGVGLSDIGRKRSNNEDSFGVFADVGVFCVADGMGGGDDGEVASAATVRAVETFIDAHRSPSGVAYSAGDFSDGICSAINDASSWICSRAKEKHLKGCGSTFVGVCFSAANPGEAIALHAGDSRLYRIRGRSIQQITKDHSAAELIGAKDEGELNPMFRGMILRAVGIQPSVEIERNPFNVRKGDRILVCSDGLSRMVPDKKILSIVRETASVETAAEALVAQANEAGGIDNVTVVLVEVGELPAPLPVVPMPKNPVGDKPDAASTLSAAASCQTTCDTSEDTAVSFDVEGASEPSTLAPIGETVSLTGITATLSGDKAEEPTMPEKAENSSKRIGRPAIIAGLAALAVIVVIAIIVTIASAGRWSERRAEEEARLRAEVVRAEQARVEEESRRAEEERERLSRLEMERERERIAEERRITEENLRKAVEAQRQAEEEAVKRAKEAALRAEAARLRVEEEKRLAEERRRRVEEEARLKAEEEARRQAEEEARLKAETEARIAAEEARRQAEVEARLRAEEEARRQAEEAARLKAEAEARIAAEEARRKAEAEQRLVSAVAKLDSFCASAEFTAFAERVKVFYEPSQWNRLSAVFAKVQGAADVSPEERRDDAVAAVECVKKIVGGTLMGVAELQIEELQDVISSGRRIGQNSAVAKRDGLEEFLGKKTTLFVTGPSDTAEAIEACVEMMRMIPKWFDL